MATPFLLLPAGIEPVAGGYLVGGAVRDLLLGHTPHDYDWVVPDPMQAAHAAAVQGGSVVALDTQRGYWRAVLGGVQHDFAPLPEVLEQELLRRDFSINALALSASGRVIDPCEGLADIQTRSLRMLSEANLRADPLRLLRGVRLATTRELRLEADTAQAITRLARAHLSLSAPERIGSELQQILQNPHAARGVLLLLDLGLLTLYFPEITLPKSPNQQAIQQMFAPLSAAKPSVAASWAALLALLLRADASLRPLPPELLARLRLPRVTAQRIERLLRALPVPRLTEPEARAFVHIHRELLPELLLLDEGLQGVQAASSRTLIAHIWRKQPTPPPALLSTLEVMQELSLPPGPALGAALRSLALAQEVEPLTTPEQARSFLQRWASTLPDG